MERDCCGLRLKGRRWQNSLLPGFSGCRQRLPNCERYADEAISKFQEALRLSPEYVIASVNLGNAYRQKHQWEEAGRVPKQALALNPEEPREE